MRTLPQDQRDWTTGHFIADYRRRFATGEKHPVPRSLTVDQMIEESFRRHNDAFAAFYGDITAAKDFQLYVRAINAGVDWLCGHLEAEGERLGGFLMSDVLLSYADASRLAPVAGSGRRIEVVLALRRHMASREWHRLLGEWWTGCDLLGRWTEELRSEINWPSRSARSAMMTTKERKALAGLPDTLTVYRGCYRNNAEGLSWSLSRRVADNFPFLRRYRQEGRPLLITGRVAKREVVLKLDRNEDEIIAADVEVVKVERAVRREINPVRE